MFEGRLPKHLADKAPRIIETEEGHEVWQFDGQTYWQVGLNAVAGRPRQDWILEPTRFNEMRQGCFNIDSRVYDQDINGVWASLNFPSQISGFCGRVYSKCADRELGIATTRAFNDWFYDEWWQPFPQRSIPCGITYLGDPEEGAKEIYRNAERGFVAVTLPEQPHRIGMPSIFSEWWEPILRACAETDTIVCLHVGSSGVAEVPRDAPAVPLVATLFGQLSLTACAEWLWSGWPVRFPNLKIALSEGGIGWVAMLYDRLENMVDRSGYNRFFVGGLRPSEVLLRNFWFCTLDDPSTIVTRHTIGVENIMFETDYPHGDSTWPDSQKIFNEVFGDLPADEADMIAYKNAASLFRHPLPVSGSRHFVR